MKVDVNKCNKRIKKLKDIADEINKERDYVPVILSEDNKGKVCDAYEECLVKFNNTVFTASKLCEYYAALLELIVKNYQKVDTEFTKKLKGVSE